MAMLPLANLTFFPWGTWMANVLGCLLIGLLSRGAELWRQRLSIGFVGAFTTFSTFSVEAVQLLQAGRTELWLVYSFSSVAAGWLLLILARSLQNRVPYDKEGRCK